MRSCRSPVARRCRGGCRSAPDSLRARRPRVSMSLEPNWQAPWFDAIRPMLAALGEDPGAGRWTHCVERLDRMARSRGLRNEQGLALAFVDAATLPEDAYERHIWRTGQVPTRTNGERRVARSLQRARLARLSAHEGATEQAAGAGDRARRGARAARRTARRGHAVRRERGDRRHREPGAGRRAARLRLARAVRDAARRIRARRSRARVRSRARRQAATALQGDLCARLGDRSVRRRRRAMPIH